MKIQKLIVALTLLVMTSLVTSCDLEVAPGAKELTNDSNQGGVEKVIIIENVVRIFMHQPNQYTYFYSTTNTNDYVSMFTVTSDFTPNKIFTDAEKGKSWVKYWGCNGSSTCMYQELHVHSLSEITGAGWVISSGKTTTKGSTSVVE